MSKAALLKIWTPLCLVLITKDFNINPLCALVYGMSTFNAVPRCWRMALMHKYTSVFLAPWYDFCSV